MTVCCGRSSCADSVWIASSSGVQPSKMPSPRSWSRGRAAAPGSHPPPRPSAAMATRGPGPRPGRRRLCRCGRRRGAAAARCLRRLREQRGTRSAGPHVPGPRAPGHCACPARARLATSMPGPRAWPLRMPRPRTRACGASRAWSLRNTWALRMRPRERTEARRTSP